MAEIKITESEEKFRPIVIELTLNTFTEFESFVGRMIANEPDGSKFTPHSTESNPAPRVHQYQFGPNSSNSITDVLYKKFVELNKIHG